MIVEGIDLPDHLMTEHSPLVLYRIHDKDSNPLFFGRTGNHRFDAPDQSFGVLYAASTREGAFVEAVLRQKTGRATRIISRTYLATRKLSTLVLSRPATMAKLRDNGLAANHTNGEISSIEPYITSQLFSRALHQHADQVSGIAYRCRHDNEQIAWAFFERSQALFDRHDTPPEALDLDDEWLEDLEIRYSIVID
jgi:hypothetical protein